MKTVEAICSALDRCLALIVPLVSEVPELILKRRASPSKWSVHEHACHLAAVHPLMTCLAGYGYSDASTSGGLGVPLKQERAGHLPGEPGCARTTGHS